MSDDNRFSFQKLDVYVAAKELMTLVVAARIRDREFRDQATRAAKSQFLNTSEGLPFGTKASRNKFFLDAKRSVWETVGAVDGALAIGVIDGERVAPIMRLAHRVDAMLNKLMR